VEGAFTGQCGTGGGLRRQTGDVFLDETGEVPPPRRSSCCGFSSTRSSSGWGDRDKQGGRADHRCDNRDLQAAVNAGLFREDFITGRRPQVKLPPAERGGYSVARSTSSASRAARRTTAGYGCLQAYAWKGNVANWKRDGTRDSCLG
jgi:DNA-binding NtrC family response regulator